MPRTFIITHSHPRLNWLTSINRSRSVPAQVVAQMSNLKTMEQAQEFARSAGLNVLASIRRATHTVNSVSIASPEGVEEYHSPQIVLPKIGCEEVPLGSALMNCLLPEISDRSEAEQTFQAYQKMAKAFSKRLEALPFACITGHKTENPQHNLDLRGFRFFFSSHPDKSFERILKMLNTYHLIFSPDTDKNAKRRAAEGIQHLKFCMFENGKMGHSILEDVLFYKSDTSLVDLR